MILNCAFDELSRTWTYKDRLLIPQIWMNDADDRPINCNCQLICLDCSPSSLLRWKKSVTLASNAIEAGCLIVWHLKTGFEDLPDGIDRGAIEIVLRAIEHFGDAVWPQFSEKSLCIVMHIENRLNHSGRDKIELLANLGRSLSAALPLDCSAGLLLNAMELSNRDQLQFFQLERFAHLHLFLKTDLVELAALNWNRPAPTGGFWSITPPKCAKITSAQSIALAFLQPGIDEEISSYQTLESAIDKLTLRDRRYRLIAPTHFNENWQNLDEVVVVQKEVSKRDRRQLEGFCAAGGRVIRHGLSLGLANEIPLRSWQGNLNGEFNF